MASVSSPGLVNASSKPCHMGAVVDVVVSLERKQICVDRPIIQASSFIPKRYVPQRCKAALLLPGFIGTAVRETACYAACAPFTVCSLNEGSSRVNVRRP